MCASSKIIELTEVSKKYKSETAVNQVSIHIEAGKIYGLLGPNGAGKTTIMKMIGGLIQPTTGHVSIYGKTDNDELANGRKRMSFMIETPYVKQQLTAKENLEIQRIQKGIPDKNRISEVLDIVGLGECGNKSVKQFSMGMKQRLGIANALMIRPEVMVLDEPVNGLDPEGMAEIRELIIKLNTEEKITIVISSHMLDELDKMCTDYIFIQKGEIVEQICIEDLHKKCGTCLVIDSDKNQLIPNIFENILKTNHFYLTKENQYKLFDYIDKPYEVSRALIDNGVTPIHFVREKENLEKYYLNLIGGKK